MNQFLASSFGFKELLVRGHRGLAFRRRRAPPARRHFPAWAWFGAICGKHNGSDHIGQIITLDRARRGNGPAIRSRAKSRQRGTPYGHWLRQETASSAGRALDRRALHQHDPHAVDGRRAAGEFRPSRHTDGLGAGGLYAVAALSALRSGGSDLAESRPLRAVQRPRLDAALFDAASRRRQGGQRRVRASAASSRSRSTTSSTSASSTASAPAIPNTT